MAKQRKEKIYYTVNDHFAIGRLTGCSTIEGARVEARIRGYQHVAASRQAAVRWANREIRDIERSTYEALNEEKAR
jgi:hypothetical protein